MTYWRSVILVFLGACSYGVLSTIVKLGYQAGFDTGDITGSQVFFGALILWLLTIGLGKVRRLSRKSGVALLFVGSFAGLTGVFYYFSLQFIPASIAIVLLFQFTWMGVLIEALLERKWPRPAQLVALLFLVVGTILAGAVWKAAFASFSVAGLLLGLLSGLTYAGFLLASGRVSVEVNPWMRSSLMTTGSVVITWLIFTPTFLMDGSLGNGLWYWGLLLALFGAVIPTLFFTYGVPHIGGGLATILGAAELPMAVFMARLVLMEDVSLVQWLGVAVILVGIVVAEMPWGKKAMMRSE